ncbi:PD-(D/E)XK nuclease family protein, partial [Candidatus Dojkabacteria bacterium]|nr:PD-(D/E)XK nuclease family protein [Candidatus Dojkabacteria bacterium]
MNTSSKEKTTPNIDLEKIYLFLDCPRCFYLDISLNLPRPSSQNPNLNMYIETLLKEEFDIHRVKDIAHPLMKTYNINAEPMMPEKMEEFRENLRLGMNCNLPGVDLTISGKLDDLWINSKGEIVVVDYHNVPLYNEFSFDMNSIINQSKKIEIYQWLFRQNNFKTTSESYYIYCTGYNDKEAFDGKLEFDVKIIPYTGDDTWVEKTIKEIHNTLRNSQPPESQKNCKYCNYRSLADTSKTKKAIKPLQYIQKEPEVNKTTYEVIIYEQDPQVTALFGDAFRDETIIDSFDQEKGHQVFNYEISCVDSWETLTMQVQRKFYH